MPFRCGVQGSALLAVAALLIQSAFSQSKPSTPPGSTGTTTGNTGALGTTTNNTSTTGNNNTTNTVQPVPVLITGRVMVDDGAPPPESATIERVCGAATRAEGYTDGRGYFAVQLGDEKGVLQDASDDTSRPMRGMGVNSSGTTTSSSSNSSLSSGGGLDRRFSNCDIRARLAGYRSQSISLATHRAMDNPDIGVILLHREGKESGTTVSMVSLGAPKEAKKAFERGLALSRKSSAEAEKEFQKAVELYPKYAAAWTEIGKIQASRSELVDARRSFDQAMEADPKFLGPYLQVSLLALEARKWPELKEVTDRAMRLDPFDYPQIYLFNAVADYNLKNYEESDRSLQAAAKLDTLQQMAEVSHLQGLLLIQRHEYAAAAERLRNYLRLAPDADDAAEVRTQLAQVDKAIAQNAASPPRPKQ
jgi:Tfp pilus assembly protein PilF